MKVTTQIIGKVDDVCEGDIIMVDGNHIAVGLHDEGSMIDTTRGWIYFNECKVVRLVLEEE